MKPNEDQRQRLGQLIQEQLNGKFKGTKNAFYDAAGVNPGTFDRALAGLPLRPASLAGIVEAGWPETGGDWQALLADGGSVATSREGVGDDALAEYSNAQLAVELARRLGAEEAVRPAGSQSGESSPPSTGLELEAAEAFDDSDLVESPHEAAQPQPEGD